MAAAGPAAGAALGAGASGANAAAQSVEEAVLAVCRQHEQARGAPQRRPAHGAAPMRAHATRARHADARFALQGLSQDQLAAALPTIDVLRVAECLNSLLNRVRACAFLRQVAACVTFSGCRCLRRAGSNTAVQRRRRRQLHGGGDARVQVREAGGARQVRVRRTPGCVGFPPMRTHVLTLSRAARSSRAGSRG
jgi:hypothetical protein